MSVAESSLTENLIHTLRALGAAGLEGCLRLDGDGVARTLFLREGRVLAVDSNADVDAMESLLFAAGVLTEEKHRRVSSAIGAGRRRGSAIVEEGGIAPSVLCEWTEKRARYLAGDLLSRKGQSFRFDEGAVPLEGTILVSLDPDLLVLQALRGGSEVITASGETVLRGGPTLARLRSFLHPHECYVLDLANGSRPVSEVLRLSEIGEHATLRCLAALEGAGCLERGQILQPVAASEATVRDGTEEGCDLATLLNLPRMAAGDPWGADAATRIRASIRQYNDLYVALCGYLMMEVGPIAEQLLEKHLREVRERHVAVFTRLPGARDGSLSEEGLLRNLSQMRDVARGEHLVAGLEAYLHGMLGAVRRILGAEHEQRVMRRLSEVRCARG